MIVNRIRYAAAPAEPEIRGASGVTDHGSGLPCTVRVSGKAAPAHWLMAILGLAAGFAAPVVEALPPGDPAVARTLYLEWRARGASEKVLLAMFEAAVVESGMQNLGWGHWDSRGVFQIRTGLWGWATATNVSLSARWFLNRAVPMQGWYSDAGALAQAVEQSSYPWKYNANFWWAKAWIDWVRANVVVIPPATYVLYRLKLGIGLNVHNGPGWNTGIAGVLKAGTVVDVYGFAGNWIKIWHVGGWRYVANLRTAKAGLSVQCMQDVRVETGYGLAGWLPKNAIIHCWAWSNHWYRVWWNGNWRWIHSMYTRAA